MGDAPRFRSIPDHPPTGIARTDADGFVVTADAHYCAIAGRDVAAILGRHFTDFLAPDEVVAARTAFEAFMASGEAGTSDDRRYEPPGGTNAWVHVTLARVDAEDAPPALMVIVHDITAQRRADEAQRIAHLGTWEYDFTTGTRTWSGSLRHLHGLADGEPFDLEAFFRRMHAGDVQRMRNFIVRVDAERQPLEDRYRVLHDDGAVHTLQISVRVLADATGNPAKSVAVIQDISERAGVEAELHRRAVQQAAVSNLGQMALTRTSLAALQWQAVAFVRDVLDADFSHLLQRAGDAFVVIEAAGLDDSVIGTRLAVAGGSAAAQAFASASTVVFDDREHEPVLGTNVKAGVIAPIALGGDGEPWGVLAAFSRTRRLFDNNDVNFVRSIATVLAQAMEREAGRRALVESEERYRSVVEGASEIIFSVAPNGLVTSLNPAFEAITGLAASDWLGRDLLDLMDAGDRQRMDAKLAEMQRSGTNVIVECAIAGRDRTVLLEVTAFSRVAGGEPGGVYGFARDITEARRIESERVRVARSLQLVLDSTVEGIYTMDVEGRCTMINAAATRMLCLDPAEILGVDMDAEVHTQPLDRNVAMVAEDVFRRRDGTSIPVDYSSAPIFDQGVAIGAVVAFTDVTERRKLEQKLEQANRLSSLGRLAATVAHEFNNVLMGIAPFLDVIRRRPSAATGAVEHISRSVTRGKRITQDILRFTQPAEPVLAAVDVESWLGRVAAEARTFLGTAHAIEVMAEERELNVTGDAGQLHQIFINLILNARDAMPDGGVIRLRARHERPDARFGFGSVAHPERYVHLMVTDTGEGMTPETLRHVFEPLFTTRKGGTGLGLAVTHQVVRHHGGEIFIESVAGAGTTFHVLLPIAERREELPSLPAGVPESVHVLIVEDDETVAAGLACLLDLDGMTSDVVTSGAEAIEYVREHPPSVVLLDVGLPDMDGRMVYARLAEAEPALPVIFSTGHADRGSLDDLLGKPHISYLLKPYDVESLNQVLKRVLRR